MAVVGVLEIQMMADMARLSNDLKRANGEIASAVMGFNNILNTLGVGISFAFFADLARRSNEFEKSLAKISTQIDDTTGDIDRLANSAKNFAAQFGTAQVEQTNAYYEIISAGIEDTAKATEILNTANKLAIGGMTSLGVSVDGLTNIMNSYAGKVESADAVSDALFIGMKAGKATMEELSSGLGKVTPLAATLDVTFDELVAVIATLSKQGIQTAESITGVRAILSAVAKPTSEATKLAAELGLEFDAASLQAKGFAGFIEDVINKTDGSTTALSTLFGRVEALVPVLSLAGTGGQDFNNILDQMNNKAGATQDAFEKMASSPGFKVDKLMAAISNAAITLGAKLSDVLTPAIVKVTQAFNNLFLTQDQSPLEKQIALISSLEKKLASELDKKNIPFGDIFLFDKRQADLYEQQLEDARADLLKLQQAQESAASSSGNLKTEIEELTGTGGGNTGVTGLGTSVDKTKQKMDSFIESIRKQAAEAGKTANEIKRMEAANLGVLHVVEPYLTIIEKQAIAEEDLRVSRQKQADDLRKIEQLTQSVRTKQEVYNDTVKELDNLLSKGLGMQAYNRALKDAQDQLAKTESSALDRSRNFWDTNEQIWIQGVRNVQTSLANGLFNVFDDGLSGMVNGVKRAVGQMIAEFASIKILQASGLAGLLGMGSTAAFASGGAASGGGLSALNLASLGSSAFNLAQGGFGLTGAIGGGLSSIGSALGIGGVANFGAGLAGTAATFTGPTAFIGGAGTAIGGSATGAAAGLGASVGAIAGPLAIAAAVDLGLKAIFGDKKLGGTAGDVFGYVPIVGTLINGLFGRGPLEFKDQTLLGDVSGGDFSGALVDRFKASGSVFRGSKTDNIILDTDTGSLLNQIKDITEGGISGKLQPVADQRSQDAIEIGKLLDDSFGAINTSLRNTAEILGLSTSGLDNFNAELRIVSEKGQGIAQEQISAEIARISDEMITSLIPSIDALSRSGETSADTLTRLGSQFSVLQSAVQLFGATADQAKEKVRGLSLEEQTALVERFGGVENLASELQGFYSNVFTDAQKLDFVEQQVRDVLEPMHIDFIPTLEQLYQAFTSGNPELFGAAVAVDEFIIEIARLKAALSESGDSSGETPAEKSAREAEEAARKADAEFKKFNASMSQVAFGSVPDMVSALSEMSDVSEELKNRALAAAAAERRAFVAGRRDAQEGKLPKPVIATTIGGKIFTEAEIREMQDAAVQAAFESSRAAVSEQLSRLNQAMQTERNAMRERVAAVKETIRFFDKFKESALDISNASFAAARAQLDSAINLVKAGASLEQIDTPELSAAIDALKQDRSGFFESRKAFEQEKADTATKLRELADAGAVAADQTINILTDQLTVMQQSYDLQVRQLNGLLGFINFQAGVNNPQQTASLSTDADLEKLIARSVNGLNEAERIRSGTTFNGSVRFPDPVGWNESADNVWNARISSLTAKFKETARGGEDISGDILTELKNLKKESSSTKDEIGKLYSIFNNVTNGGNAMKTTAA